MTRASETDFLFLALFLLQGNTRHQKRTPLLVQAEAAQPKKRRKQYGRFNESI